MSRVRRLEKPRHAGNAGPVQLGGRRYTIAGRVCMDQVVLDIGPDVVDHVIGDSQRIKQVLLNLVGNAIKFTEHGSVSLTLNALSASRSGYARVRFEVIDSGVGVPPEAKDKVLPVLDRGMAAMKAAA